jgi:predicted DNA-binding protein
MAQPRLYVRFPLEIYHTIKNHAKDTNSTLSAVIAVAVTAYFEKQKKD